MNNCIFTPHCTEGLCDKSCPILVETSYLLERNGINMNSPVFNIASDKSLNLSQLAKFVTDCECYTNSVCVCKAKNTIKLAEVLTYLLICRNWKGSRLHCNVYNLKYSKFIEDTKQSWNTKTEPESLEYMRIWANTSKILVVSNMDYVNFRDFECQTLLTLIQSRQSNHLPTVLVLPDSTLVGDSKFLGKLTAMFRESEVSIKA